MAIQAKLIFRSGDLSGNKRELSGDLLRIGRDPANDFVVENIEVSRNHSKITHSEGLYTLEDLNSTNGTFLNGRKISTPERLKDGDLISFGEANVFEFSLDKEVEAKVEPEFPGEEKSENEVKKDFFSKMKTEPEFDNGLDANEPRNEKGNVIGRLSKLPTWAVVLLIALGFIVLFCIIPLFFIEITNQWCNLFSGFFNAISPGTCL
jgi:predicted component of type VI protein secretion system